VVKRKCSPKRSRSGVVNYVQTVKRIRLEFDEEQTEGDKDDQSDKEEQDVMQHHESEQSEGQVIMNLKKTVIMVLMLAVTMN